MNDDHAADDLRPERLLRPGLRTLDELEQRLGDFSTELSHDEAIELINAAVALAQRARRLQDECFELGLIWTTTNGPLVCGTRRYEPRQSKRVTCLDVATTTLELIDVAGGELEELSRYLLAQPFRYGACGSALPEAAYDRLFKTTWSGKLALTAIDTTFVRRQPRKKGATRG